MEVLRAYILSVVAAAVLCAMAIRLMGKNGTGVAILRMVCGVTMAAVILQPLGQLRMPGYTAYFSELETQVRDAVALGTEKSREELSLRIQQKTQAYLQNKAEELGADLEIRVQVSEDCIPEAVTLWGSVSPTAKTILSEVMIKDLGIGEEGQFWK